MRDYYQVMAGTTSEDNRFAEWLLARLGDKRWTPSDLAKAIGVNSGSISNVINRKTNLGPDLARQIADALEISQVELFAAAMLIDKPISPRNVAEAELMTLADDLTTDERDTLIWFARSLRQKRQAKEHNEKTNPAIRTQGRGARAS